MKKTFKRMIALLLVTVMVAPQAVLAQDQDTKKESLYIMKGDLYKFETFNMTRVSVVDPEVADISDAQAAELMILGKKLGQTTMFVWDDVGKHAVTITVVNEDLDELKKRIDEILATADISDIQTSVSSTEGKVVLTGDITKGNRVNFDKLIESFNESIINLVKDESYEQLVQVDVYIAELNSSASKNLGIAWANSAGVSSGGGQNNSGDFSVNYGEQLPTFNGKLDDFFKIGKFYRSAPLVATLNAMVEEGKGRLLSKPRLVVKSGKEASFNVGGEIPVKKTTFNSPGSTVSQETTFKRYGITMTVTPTITETSLVDMVVNLEISDVDPTKSTSTDIAYITRSAQTNLMLEDNQTIVMAGLIKHNDGEVLKRIPGLSRIPIVGLLFRNRRTPTANADTELVIVLTPHIIKEKKIAKEKDVMPSKKINEFVKEIDSNMGTEKEPIKHAVKPNFDVVTKTDTSATDYVRSVQQQIAKSITFPYEALENNYQGTVKLKLRIKRDGTLAQADVMQTSGQMVLDDDALNTAKMAAPYAQFPTALVQDEVIVTIPVVYTQLHQ